MYSYTSRRDQERGYAPNANGRKPMNVWIVLEESLVCKRCTHEKEDQASLPYGKI